MPWTSFFDRIYVVNLPRRTDRRNKVIKELNDWDIPFTVWPAIEDSNGAIGLFKTMQSIFDISLKNDWKNVLIFEDDVRIIEPRFHSVMECCIDQLPFDYHLLYLGVNPSKGFSHFHSQHLLPIKNGFSSHAVGYSERGMLEVVDASPTMPYDRILAQNVQVKEKSYCTFPMLVSQCDGYSDVEKRNIKYSRFLEERYQKKIKDLKI